MRTFGDWRHGDDVTEGRSCPVAKKRDPLRVAAEGRDVLSEPVEPRHEVHEAVVSLGAAPRPGLEEPCSREATGVRQ